MDGILAYFYLGSTFAYVFTELAESGKLRPDAGTWLRALAWPVVWVPWVLIVILKMIIRARAAAERLRGGGE
jgi:hypothetical protein